MYVFCNWLISRSTVSSGSIRVVLDWMTFTSQQGKYQECSLTFTLAACLWPRPLSFTFLALILLKVYNALCQDSFWIQLVFCGLNPQLEDQRGWGGGGWCDGKQVGV